MVDARHDHVGLEVLDQSQAGKPHAVHRRAVGGIAHGAVIEGHLRHPQRPAGSDRARHRRAVAIGRYDRQAHPLEADERTAHGLQAVGFDPVVVCEQNVEHLATSSIGATAAGRCEGMLRRVSRLTRAQRRIGETLGRRRTACASALVTLLVAFAGGPASLAATPADTAATGAYLRADYELDRAVLANARASDSAVSTLAKVISGECPGVLAGVPNEELNPGSFTPRVRGERQREEMQFETIREEFAQAISAAVYKPDSAAIQAFVAQITPLSWSDPRIAALVHFDASSIQEDLVSVPQVCADMRAWAQTGYHTLSPASRAFKAAQKARVTAPRPTGSIKALLQPYEDAAQRTLVRRTEALRSKTKEAFEEINSQYTHLQRALGLPESQPEVIEHQKVLGRGHTEAGETFVVRHESPRTRPEQNCQRSVSVELKTTSANGRSSSGSSGSVCLSERSRGQPPTQCGGGVWGITAAVPPSVWTVRLRLSSGRTLTSEVVRIPAREGGPGGVYVQSLRPHTPHAVSLTELDRRGKVVRVVKLTETRCEVEGGPHEGPTFVPLANGSTPGGEPFRIEGVLVHAGHHQTFFNLSLEADVEGRTNESHAEGPIGQTRRPFSWSLTTGCPPHSFSIIYGTLAAPGVSVSALTPAGLIPLTEMQLAANLHAAGPLFYAALSTAPSELVVKGSNGQTLYTESVVAKAKEDREFCEGYGEEA